MTTDDVRGLLGKDRLASRPPAPRSTPDYLDSIYRFWLAVQKKVDHGLPESELLEIGLRVQRIEEVSRQVLEDLGMDDGPDLRLAA